MKPYVFLAIGALWLIVAILARRGGFSIWVAGGMNPVLLGRLFTFLFPAILWGWVVPIAFGVWLLRRK